MSCMRIKLAQQLHTTLIVSHFFVKINNYVAATQYNNSIVYITLKCSASEDDSFHNVSCHTNLLDCLLFLRLHIVSPRTEAFEASSTGWHTGPFQKSLWMAWQVTLFRALTHASITEGLRLHDRWDYSKENQQYHDKNTCVHFFTSLNRQHNSNK